MQENIGHADEIAQTFEDYEPNDQDRRPVEPLRHAREAVRARAKAETETRWDPMAANDHSDWRWDEDVLKSLAGLSRSLRPVGDQLAQALARFACYPERFVAALDRVDQGRMRWVDEPRIDSCHTVWFELHEDLLATLGLERGDGA